MVDLFSVAVLHSLTGQLPLDHADPRLVSSADTPLETLLTMAQVGDCVGGAHE